MHVNANAILAKPIKNREAETITKGWEKINNRIVRAGEKPAVYIIDNEASRNLKQTMKAQGIDYQLVPPHNHRANLAERAIQTFKSHLKAGLSSVDPDFPISQWDRLIPQAEITINLLRNAKTNPKLSAYAFLFGQFDFARTPMAPPGAKVVAHTKPGQRETWAPHGEVGFYVGPATEHYRCYKVYFPKTRTVRNVDTVKFISSTITLPIITIDEYLKQAASDIIDILKNPPSTMIPTLQAGDTTNNALTNLADLLQRVEYKPNRKDINEDMFKDKGREPRVIPTPRLNSSYIGPKSPRNESPFNDMSHFKRSQPQTHNYNLRPRTIYAGRYALAAKHIEELNHIYDDNGKRIRILDLLKGENDNIWK